MSRVFLWHTLWCLFLLLPSLFITTLLTLQTAPGCQRDRRGPASRRCHPAPPRGPPTWCLCPSGLGCSHPPRHQWETLQVQTRFWNKFSLSPSLFVLYILIHDTMHHLDWIKTGRTSKPSLKAGFWFLNTFLHSMPYISEGELDESINSYSELSEWIMFMALKAIMLLVIWILTWLVIICWCCSAQQVVITCWWRSAQSLDHIRASLQSSLQVSGSGKAQLHTTQICETSECTQIDST